MVAAVASICPAGRLAEAPAAAAAAAAWAAALAVAASAAVLSSEVVVSVAVASVAEASVAAAVVVAAALGSMPTWPEAAARLVAIALAAIDSGGAVPVDVVAGGRRECRLSPW